jgi:hypothetical protein
VRTSYYLDDVVCDGLCITLAIMLLLLPICDVVNILFICCHDYYNIVDVAYNFLF